MGFLLSLIGRPWRGRRGRHCLVCLRFLVKLLNRHQGFSKLINPVKEAVEAIGVCSEWLSELVRASQETLITL